MAKANWLKVDPSHGSGNATVKVSSIAEHTGRKARTTTLIWTAANVQDVVRNVSQAGKPEYVNIAESALADKADKVGSTIEIGFITLYNGNLWKARQTHTALEVYPPSLNTASLYEVIVEEHSGEAYDPIPYILPIEIYEGKYYIEDGIIYRCTRDNGVALSHKLSVLIGIYVEVI